MSLLDHKHHVGRGWHPLLEELDRELSALDPEIEILQVKEKFGVLRVYAKSAERHRVSETIRKYETRSASVCEACGAPGELRDHHYWVKTLCDDCSRFRDAGEVLRYTW